MTKMMAENSYQRDRVHTLRTFSLALAVFSWRERLRTERLWCRFSERPSWRPPDVELPSLPSLRPEAASERQLNKKKTSRDITERLDILLNKMNFCLTFL